MLQFSRLTESSQLHEYFIHIGAEFFVAGKQAKISIKPGGAGMIIASTYVHITPQFAVFTPHYHCHLGVGFVTYHAIYHVGTNFFQATGPVDIGFLIETRQQFHHHRYFFAATCRGNKSRHYQ